MYNRMFDFQDRLQNAVCDGARAAFADLDTCEAITNGFARGLEVFLGPGARTATVQMKNGQICFGLFRHTQAAVA